MTGTEIITMVKIGMYLTSKALAAAERSRQEGDITPEQLQEVRQRAQVSEADWDAAVQEARRKLAEDNPTT